MFHSFDEIHGFDYEHHEFLDIFVDEYLLSLDIAFPKYYFKKIYKKANFPVCDRGIQR
jgi:hypothetical protein